jgi:type VI secretion system protein ImpA
MAKPVLTTNVDGKRVTNDFSEHEPDWVRLASRCEELLKVTRDLRVATFYSAALLRVDGFQGFVHGLELIRKMILASDYQAYPQFDPGDRGVLLERWYTLIALGSAYKQEGDLLRIIEGVRAVPLAKNKSLPCRYFDVVSARNQAGGVDATMVERLRIEWKKISVEERAATSAALSTALGALAEIEAVLLEQTPEALIPSGTGARPMQGLALELKGLLEFINSSIPNLQSKAAKAVSEVPAFDPGEIRSRADAIRLLQQAAEFFRKTEPSSPVPYFVERAVRLVDRDFMGLLGDLVPDAVPKFQSLAGVEDGTAARA